MRPAERLDPFRRVPVLLRPFRARNHAVGDVANEQVEERVLRFLGDRGRSRPLHEPLPLERVQDLLRVRARPTIDDSAEPEHLSDRGRVLEEELLRPGQAVEPCRDDPLHGLRQRQIAGHGAFKQQLPVLLRVQRVAAGAGK